MTKNFTYSDCISHLKNLGIKIDWSSLGDSLEILYKEKKQEALSYKPETVSIAMSM